ncbi:MAG TPA: hypothetical protein VFC63_15965 [Blastocatellia bacterium]|nr:hypothetical protein [Blastocatellia bacterium]
MNGVRLSKYFGIIIRKDALLRQGVDDDTICQIMDRDKPYDEDASLISFGPHFGEEGAEEFVSRLRKLGLIYLEDFFVLWDDVPEWAEIKVKLDPKEAT